MSVMKRHEFRNIVAGAIVAALLAACQTPQAPTSAAPTATPVTERTPFIAVAPDRTAPGGPLSVIGSDWRANEEVTISMVSTIPTAAGSIVLAIVFADAQGRFRLDTLVPARVIPGVWQVFAQTRTAGRFASASVTVIDATATASAQPTATAAVVPTRPAPTRPPAQPPSRPIPTATRFVPPPPTWTPPAPTIPPPTFADWRGEYYANIDLIPPPVVIRNDTAINFDWGFGSPDPRLPADFFSVRWTRQLTFDPGTYRFQFRVDDGVRMFIDNVLVLSQWAEGPPREVFTDVTLSGTRSFRVEYFEKTGMALIQLTIFRLQPVPPPPPSPFPTSTFTPPPPPTLTPLPTAIPPRPTVTFTAIPPAPATSTAIPLPPSATPTRIVPATATATTIPIPPTSTATATTIPLPPTATATQVPPTATATPTLAPPTATATAVPPTATDLPPTATAVPPTATEVPTDVPPTATTQPPDEPTATPTEVVPEPTPTDTVEPPTPTATVATEPTATPTVPAGPAVTATLRLDTLRLNVVGTGWPARERVTLILTADPDATEGEALGAADTNRQGRFTKVVTLTVAPPETAYVIVTDAAGNREVALIRQTR